MAITITIGDGTDTVTLTGTDAYLESYAQETPGADAQTVIESLEVEFFGGTATIDANIKELQLLLERGKERADGNIAITKVFMTVTLDSDVWRSPIYDGKVVTPGTEWLKGDRALGIRRATILVTRAPWWEDATERQISLTNGNGTDNTAGLKVYMNNSGTGSSPNKQNNYVEITAAKVAGDLPAPVRFELAYTAADQAHVLIGSNVFSDPANLVYWYETEVETTRVADATASGGYYEPFSCAAAGEDIYRTISTQLDELRGGWFRILGRVASTGVWNFRPIYLDGHNFYYGTRITRTLAGAATFQVIDFGVMQLPPAFLTGMASTYPAMGVEAGPDTGTRTLNMDYLQITPLQSWKDVTFDLWVTPGTMMLDDMEERDYVVASGATISFGVPMGGGLKVWPNRLQRFVFLMADVANVVTTYTTVKLFYRPRRRML
jgi:hypothetical protein